MKRNIDRTIAILCFAQILMTPCIPRTFLGMGDFNSANEYLWYVIQSFMAFSAGMAFLQALKNDGFRNLRERHRRSNASYQHFFSNIHPITWKKNQSVSEILEEVEEEICNHYCKWPDKWDEETEGVDLSESTLCKNCPLNRL